MTNLEKSIEKLKSYLLQVNRVKTEELLEKCYQEKNDIRLIETMVIKALASIGEDWGNGSVSLSQVYMSGVICEELIEKYLGKIDTLPKNTSKIAITVLQDHHALGKKIVLSVLRASGYEVSDFGQGLSVHDLVERSIDENIDILLISTLMLPTALKIKEVREKFIENNIDIKIIVGGAPFRFDGDLWKRVGADADGKTATDVIKVIEKVLNN